LPDNVLRPGLNLATAQLPIGQGLRLRRLVV